MSKLTDKDRALIERVFPGQDLRAVSDGDGCRIDGTIDLVEDDMALLLEAARQDGRQEADRDAARYAWLRDDNAYAPEEEHVRGGEELDALCDEGIARNNDRR